MTPLACAQELRRAGWRLDHLAPTTSGRLWWAIGIDTHGRAVGLRGKTPDAACARLVRACQRSTDRTQRVGRRATGHHGPSGLRSSPPPVDRRAADTE